MKSENRVDVSQLKMLAAGNWDMIFKSLVSEYDDILFQKAGRKHGPCPLCGGEDRFQFYKDADDTGGSICRGCGPKSDGIELVAQANSWSFVEALKAIHKVLGGEEVTPEIQQKREKENHAKRQRRQRMDEFFRENLRRVWTESLPAEATEAAPLRRYLANRGLNPTQYPKTLRFHPGLESFNTDKESEGVWPALVALVVDRHGEPVTVHRIFLTDEGQKAPIEEPKKMMPYPSDRKVTGGAIHLSGTGPVLHVAEGIETAFAVMEMMDGEGSFWATISSSLMRNLDVGEPVEALWVWADLDRSSDGQTSARTLVDQVRETGRQAQAVIPPVPIPAGEKAVDWLDIWNHWRDSIAMDKAKFIKRTTRKRKVA